MLFTFAPNFLSKIPIAGSLFEAFNIIERQFICYCSVDPITDAGNEEEMPLITVRYWLIWARTVSFYRPLATTKCSNLFWMIWRRGKSTYATVIRMKTVRCPCLRFCWVKLAVVGQLCILIRIYLMFSLSILISVIWMITSWYIFRWVIFALFLILIP